MDVYPHLLINDELDVCYDTLLPILWPVYDTSIVRSYIRDAAAPSVAHDHEQALTGLFPKQHFGILSGPTHRYIESLHLCPETCPSTAPFRPSRTDQCSAVTPVSSRVRIVLLYGTNSTALFTA